MIYLYLLLALFSCDLAQSRGVPLWYKEIESLLANHLSNDEKMAVAMREGVEFTGTLSEIEDFLKYASKEGQNIAFNHNFDLEDSMESIIGTDERHLQNPNIYPFTAMGIIAIGCTGTFISPHVVLTAAHCVYNSNTGQYYSYLDFYRGKHCGSVYSSVHKFSHIFIYDQWKTSRDRNYDIAWIVYSTPSPVHMPYTSNMPPVGTEISIYGYPADKQHACLWGSSKPLTVIYEKRLQYEVDTYGGMSGSAIYYNDGGNPVIIGVHTTGYPGHFNRGTRMTVEYKRKSDGIIHMYD